MLQCSCVFAPAAEGDFNAVPAESRVMPYTCQNAIELWRRGVRAVEPREAVGRCLCCRVSRGRSFEVLFRQNDGQTAAEILPPGAKVIVVGFGKASGAMADACEEIFAPLIPSGRLSGWVNVPADQVTDGRVIRRHAGRPAGVNEPRPEGVEGTRKIVELIGQAAPDDLVIALVSGGGSALLPLPIPEITLEQKTAVTRFLSGAGANIIELNTVRGTLSEVKSGGLLRLAEGKRLYSLILSDVLGSPLSIIAGGATVPAEGTPAENARRALAILERFGAQRRAELVPICDLLRRRSAVGGAPTAATSGKSTPPIILADNPLAAAAAGAAARQLGLSVLTESADSPEGTAESVGLDLLRRFRRQVRESGGPRALISGGEPVVELVPKQRRGRGGRNTQLVLAALIEVLRRPAPEDRHLVFLSGGTDGEDGPTDAAGAYFDPEIVERVRQMTDAGEISPEDYLARNDAYTFFERCGGLLKSGPTGTNVCDLRILLSE